MSVNHYSSSLPEPHWWSQYTMESSAETSSSHQETLISTSTANTDASAAAAGAMIKLNNEDEDELLEEQEITKEPLFEKPLTPSDVGKLNRLVIPKQHAEKYFPLNGGGGGGEKGSLLSFEDEVGKSWRFRYSYWNSSQSYVLTKGWSRFVKEKRLDAGDFVIFTRHRGDGGRLFIGWRRRNSVNSGGGVQESGVAQAPSAAGGRDGGWMRRVFYPYPSQHGGSSSLPYQLPDCHHAGPVVEKQTKAASGGNLKRLRLFGVNLEWQAGDE